MHELPVTEEILNKVIVHANENGLDRVNKIYVRLGEFSGYVDESIDFYWNIVAEKTIAANAKVVIHREPGKIKCLSCGRISKIVTEVCESCQSHRLKIIAGSNLILEKIEGE